MTATPTDHAAAFSAAGTHDARVAALRRLPVRQRVLLAADWAEAVLPIWEEAYPADGRPRRAIEAARAGDEDVAYTNAAYAAAYAAANAANAAYDAAAAAYAAAAAATFAAAAYAADAAAYGANAGSTYAAYAAAHAAHAAGRDWSGVRRLWDAAYNAGHAWRPEWRTPLAVEMARDPADYPVLLDLLADESVPVEGLRGLPWRLSNWAVYHLLSPAGGQR